MRKNDISDFLAPISCCCRGSNNDLCNVDFV